MLVRHHQLGELLSLFIHRQLRKENIYMADGLSFYLDLSEKSHVFSLTFSSGAGKKAPFPQWPC